MENNGNKGAWPKILSCPGKAFWESSLSMGSSHRSPVIKHMKSGLTVAPDVPELLKKKWERRQVLFPWGRKRQQWITQYRAVLLLVPKPVPFKAAWVSLPSSATDAPFGSSFYEKENDAVGSQSRFPFHEEKVTSRLGHAGYEESQLRHVSVRP